MRLKLALSILPIVLLGLSLRPTGQQAAAQGSSDVELAARMLSAVNAARIADGLPPYAQNPLLTQSAQAHSEYQRDTGQITHTGPGEARPYDRALALGYPAVRVNENIYAGIGGPEQAVEWWLTADEPHRHNVLHPVLREVGVGAATNEQGRTYYTLDISAQPNVLPIFIDNDAPVTRSETVMLTLTNEEVFYGAAQIGYATQIMISNSPDFAGAITQPWARFIAWGLDTERRGQKTVYVRFLDASGRTADAQDSILYDPRSSAEPPTAVTVPPLAGTTPYEAAPDNSPTVTLTASASATVWPTLTSTASPFVTPTASPWHENLATESVEPPLPLPSDAAAVPTPNLVTLAGPTLPDERQRSLSHYLAPGILIAGVGAALIGAGSIIWKWFAAYRGRRDGNY